VDDTTAANPIDWKQFVSLHFNYCYGTIPTELVFILNIAGKHIGINRVSLATGDIVLVASDRGALNLDTFFNPSTNTMHRDSGGVSKRKNKIINHLANETRDWGKFIQDYMIGAYSAIDRTAFQMTVQEYIDWTRQEAEKLGVKIIDGTCLMTRYGGEPWLINDIAKINYTSNRITVIRNYKSISSYTRVRAPRIACHHLGGFIGVPLQWVFNELEKNFSVICDPLAWKTPENGKDPFLTIRTMPRPSRKKRGES